LFIQGNEGFVLSAAAAGRDEETSGVTQSPKGRSKIKIVSEPQAATAHSYFFEVYREMAKKIDKAQVRKVAKLARLELAENEIEEFTVQLSAILEYVEKMNELDTANVEPLAHCLPISNVFREDSIKASLGTEKTLANAPQRDGEFFKVPKILDEM
jgi:aspartyl-tRNA(Asn)/glutamyl-tRNA(Gln) amidotransferase subunit C